MPRYRVRNRITGETYEVEAPFAQDACERVGWLIGNCHVELQREGPYTRPETPRTVSDLSSTKGVSDVQANARGNSGPVAYHPGACGAAGRAPGTGTGMIAGGETMTEPIEGWLTTTGAAELTGYNVKYLRWLINQGRIEARKVQRDWLVNKESLLAYKARMDALGAQKHNPWREDLGEGRGRRKGGDE